MCECMYIILYCYSYSYVLSWNTGSITFVVCLINAANGLCYRLYNIHMYGAQNVGIWHTANSHRHYRLMMSQCSQTI